MYCNVAKSLYKKVLVSKFLRWEIWDIPYEWYNAAGVYTLTKDMELASSEWTYHGLRRPNLVLVREVRKPTTGSVIASQTRPVKMMARTYVGSNYIQK